MLSFKVAFFLQLVEKQETPCFTAEGLKSAFLRNKKTVLKCSRLGVGKNKGFI